MSRNLSKLSGRQGMENNLFTRLVDAITEGEDTSKDLDGLAEEFLVGKANLYGTRTFYDFLRGSNDSSSREKKVYVCNGSACLCANTQDRLIREMKKYFKEEKIGTMTCLGRCYENAAFHYKGRNYSNQPPHEIADVITSGKSVEDYYSVVALGLPVLTATYEGLEKHYLPLGKALKRRPEELLQEVKESGLRGRGGAGYSTGMKWESCRNASSDMKFIGLLSRISG